MVRRRSLPPPIAFTIRDALQILLGVIMVPLGVVILYNTATRGATVPGLLIGGAFVVFGLYRMMFAWGRVRWFLQIREENKHD